MNVIDAFLMATAWAYLGCLSFTILGRPPMANIKKEFQGLFYTFAWIILLFSSIDIFPQYIYAVLGVVYSFASVGSFIGWPQAWMSYWTNDPERGSAPGQIGMACWDLALAVCFFMKLPLTYWLMGAFPG